MRIAVPAIEPMLTDQPMRGSLSGDPDSVNLGSRNRVCQNGAAGCRSTGRQVRRMVADAFAKPHFSGIESGGGLNVDRSGHLMGRGQARARAGLCAALVL